MLCVWQVVESFFGLMNSAMPGLAVVQALPGITAATVVRVAAAMKAGMLAACAVANYDARKTGPAGAS